MIINNGQFWNGVVCVNDSWPLGQSPLVKGAEYIIEWVGLDDGISPYTDGVSVSLVLKGVLNPTAEDGLHTFDVRRFRPLQTRTQEQDVALFRHHLTGAPVTA